MSPNDMRRIAFALLLLAAPPAAGEARDALGVFSGWGAFRDAAPPRCYAIALPQRAGGGAAWPAFAAVSSWPGRAVRGQVHVRLSRARRRDAPVSLAIGAGRFALVAGRADAWAPDPRTDAAIVAAMRSGETLVIAARDERGARFADRYALKGAATAIDAAAIGCARTG